MTRATIRARTPRGLPLETVLAAVLAVLAVTVGTASASAHGFTSVVYAELTHDGDAGRTSAELQLEYDLLVASAADAEGDDPLFRDGSYAMELGDDETRAQVLQEHADSVLGYIAERFVVATAGMACDQSPGGAITMTVRDAAPYAVIPIGLDCAGSGADLTVTSTLFADDEDYVTGTTTILEYDVDGRTGSAALDQERTSFSTEQSPGERFVEFFLLGAEHLLGGIDHILFLLALIAGSRRLREVVLAATAFTVAHSVTFILAAVGVVNVPATVIEPIIAISISIVAAWYLFRLVREGRRVDELVKDAGPLGLDRAGWTRIGVVFVFGLVHGLGFASALGIDEPWSWTLLWSLLVFNVGIEAVQLTIIAVLFPVLTLVRRRSPRAGTWLTAALTAVVTIVGLVWLVQRILGV